MPSLSSCAQACPDPVAKTSPRWQRYAPTPWSPSSPAAVAARPAAVNVTIDLPTLLGLQDNPGESAGYGPLPAPLARTLTADGRWRRMILDPTTGGLLDLGHTSYTPSAPLARFVKTRDRTCISPTCNRTAQRCDIDHSRRYSPDDPGGGRTDCINLRPLCTAHHRLKHHTGWTLRTNPTTGRCAWISPTCHHYDVEHEDHRSVVAADDVPETPAAKEKLDPCPFQAVAISFELGERVHRWPLPPGR